MITVAGWVVDWPLVGLGVLVFFGALAVDLAHAKYVRSLVAGRRHAAARWSVGQWIASTIGFVVAVKISLWLLPAEALGLYAGALLGIGREVDEKSKSR